MEQATEAIALAGLEHADIICFPECFVPGYRAPNKNVPPPDAAFLDRAWSAVEAAAGAANVAVVLGTERIVGGRPMITALVVDRDGTRLGFQDKVQIDPSEEITYTSGAERRTFQSGPLTFGVVICHEGWRYPETVRWAARRGAQVVFHPQFHEADGRQLSACLVRRSEEHVPRKGRALPRCREHVLLRDGELRRRGVADDVGRRSPGRYAVRIPTLRATGTVHRRSRSERGDRPARSPLQSLLTRTPRWLLRTAQHGRRHQSINQV